MQVVSRAPRLSRRAQDGVLAAVLVTLGQVQVWTGWNAGGVGAVPHGAEWARAVLVLCSAGPLAWRRVRPLPVAAVIGTAIVVQLLAVAPYVAFLPALLPLSIANYTVAAYGDRWRPAGLALVVATEAVVFARVPEERVPGEVLFALFVAVGTWLAGDVVRGRLHRADRAVGVAREQLAEQEAAAAAALAEERVRIARELHDVIAHSVSVMGVQAGAARTLLDADPDAARNALRSIETTARDSVGELQRLLAVLREPDEGQVDLTPQPGLTELPRLVERVRSAGLPVQLTVHGAGAGVGDLSPGVDLVAYRIVQEALTNALKHAGTATTVSVCRGPDALRIEVRSAGTARRPPGGPGGHGLIGMRERAQLYGGTVDAGPSADGGFAVRAHLPLGPGPR